MTRIWFQADTGLDGGNPLEEPLLDNAHDAELVSDDVEHQSRFHLDNSEVDDDETVALFSILDHFCYLFFTPTLFLLHYHNVSMKKCETNWEDHSFFCTLHNMTGYGWKNCIPISVVFFVLSVYMYKISLYEIAPWMFFRRTTSETCSPMNCCMDTVYQGLVSLPEVMLILMFGCILVDSVENCLLTMLFTTSGFSLFTIIVTTNLVLTRPSQ